MAFWEDNIVSFELIPLLYSQGKETSLVAFFSRHTSRRSNSNYSMIGPVIAIFNILSSGSAFISSCWPSTSTAQLCQKRGEENKEKTIYEPTDKLQSFRLPVRCLMIFSFSFYFEYIYLLTATRINIRRNNRNRVTFEPWCAQKKGNEAKKKRRRFTGFPSLNDGHFHENNGVAMGGDDGEATKLLYAYAHRSINSKSISLTKLTTPLTSTCVQVLPMTITTAPATYRTMKGDSQWVDRRPCSSSVFPSKCWLNWLT